MAHAVFVAGGTGYLGRRLIPRLLARGHRVRALARPGSASKVPAGCEVVAGDPFNRATFAQAIAAADTYVQLVGVPHPSPAKAKQFVDIDLRSAVESIAAAREAGVAHFVYVSVAQPAPVMQAYQAARGEAERVLAKSGPRPHGPAAVVRARSRSQVVLRPAARLLAARAPARDTRVGETAWPGDAGKTRFIFASFARLAFQRP